MIFSVITPTHFRPEKLQLLIKSLEQQTLAPDLFEVIIVPSPLDPSIQNTTSARLNIRLLSPEHDPYQGKSASYKRNLGAQSALAPWLAFVDDDCIADADWLKNASIFLQNSKCQAIEGMTRIPVPDKKTYTYKGLQRLSKAGGYQTCNMFYNRQVFLESGGFDLNFPFYLEDTDLAWTLLDAGHSIGFNSNCVVEHPVPSPDVDRLLFNAYRAKLIPYLYKKHPKLFKTQNWKALQRFQWLFLILHTALLMIFFTNPGFNTFFLILFSITSLSVLYTTKQLWNCSFEFIEALKMCAYYTVTPWITLFQLWRGNFIHRVFVWR